MSTTSLESLNTPSVYTLNKLKQIIDLNGDLVDFKLSFSAVSSTNENFYAVVASQSALDDEKTVPLEYQLANGSISGTISVNDGIFQTYYLIMKSDTPNEVSVTLELEPIKIEMTPIDVKPVVPKKVTFADTPPAKKSGGVSRKWFFIVLGVVLLVFALFMLYRAIKPKNKKEFELPPPLKIKVIPPPKTPTAHSPVVSSILEVPPPAPATSPLAAPIVATPIVAAHPTPIVAAHPTPIVASPIATPSVLEKSAKDLISRIDKLPALTGSKK